MTATPAIIEDSLDKFKAKATKEEELKREISFLREQLRLQRYHGAFVPADMSRVIQFFGRVIEIAGDYYDLTPKELLTKHYAVSRKAVLTKHGTQREVSEAKRAIYTFLYLYCKMTHDAIATIFGLTRSTVSGDMAEGTAMNPYVFDLLIQEYRNTFADTQVNRMWFGIESAKEFKKYVVENVLTV